MPVLRKASKQGSGEHMVEIKQVSAIPWLVDDIMNHLNTGKYNGKTLIWFGFSPYLDTVQRELLKRGQRIDFVVDNEKFKWGLDPWGILKCHAPEILTDYAKDGVVMIMNKYKEAMTAQIKSYGYSDEQIICLNSLADYSDEIMKKHFSNLNSLRKMSLKDVQEVLFRGLKAFRDFCEKHGLRYFLAEGTLLGAVRHKGFIPWDDDVDVFMPYEDMQKLVKLYRNDERHELLHWSKTNGHNYTFIRFADIETYYYQEYYFRCILSAVGVDILPIGGYPSSQKAQELRIKEIYDHNIRWESLAYSEDTNAKILKAYQEIERHKYRDSFDDSKYIGMYNFLSKRVSAWTVSKKFFSETIDVEFAGELFRAPVGYDQYLTARYGDYMTPPPESERYTHPWVAYWKS